MKNFLATLAVITSILGVSVAHAADPQPASPAVAKQVKAAVEGWLKGRFKVDTVSKTSMPGIVEVKIGNDLVYVDEKATHVIVEGQMVDLKTGLNLTAARMDDIQRIDFAKLPLDLAMKSVKGDGGKGKRTIAVFEDPYCSFCRKFRQTLMTLDNVTIYTYFYPILRAESTTVSRNAWCAKDRQNAWDDWMLLGKEPPTAGKDCNFPKDKIVALGQQLGVQATPTSFVVNGKRLQGALSKEQIEAALK
jgi:thiol:disulfide interchange protein DsbC